MVAQNVVQDMPIMDEHKFIVTYGGDQEQDDHATIPVVHESFEQAYEFMVLMRQQEMQDIELSSVTADDCFENHKIPLGDDNNHRAWLFGIQPINDFPASLKWIIWAVAE
jgi:hypothetical protein